MTADGGPDDPVLLRRAKIARLTLLGRRLGWLGFGVAVAAFLVGAVVGFSPTIVRVVLTALVLGSVFLAPAIVFSYAVRAAEREERDPGGRSPP